MTLNQLISGWILEKRELYMSTDFIVSLVQRISDIDSAQIDTSEEKLPQKPSNHSYQPSSQADVSEVAVSRLTESKMKQLLVLDANKKKNNY